MNIAGAIVSGAIFDMDGTLVDSMSIWKNIGEKYLLSLEINPQKDLHEKLKSMSMLQATSYFQKHYKIKLTSEEIIYGINSLLNNFYSKEVELKKGVQEALIKLQKTGVKMCIATSTDLHLAEVALQHTKIRSFFSAIFTCSEVGFGKDSPEIYQSAISHLQTCQANTLVFEDALYAINTAKKAGFIVVGVGDESQIKDRDNIINSADYYINSFSEINKIKDKGECFD